LTEFSPKSLIVKYVLVGVKAFIKATKKSDPYITYTTLMCKKNNTSSIILLQYKKFEDVFEKKNINIVGLRGLTLGKYKASSYN